ncbi:POK11 protein, partial [Corythaixoides concolor]|nr:POK11 protein [Corythaixoides concolor]
SMFKKRLCASFASLSVPLAVKTDNGSAYVSHCFQLWGIEHTTGIPHSPTGQAIIERAHQT